MKEEIKGKRNGYIVKELKKPIDDALFNRLFKINNRSFETKGYRKEYLREALNTQDLLIAEDSKGNILGFLLSIPEAGSPSPPQTKNRLHVTYLAVDPAAQNSGIGKALMREVMRRSEDGVLLECRPRNEVFYQKLGFKTIDPIRPDYYKDNKRELPGLPMVFDKDIRQLSI